MSLVVHLSRHVRRRAAEDVVKRHLHAAIKAVVKVRHHMTLTRLSIQLTDAGHTAVAYFAGRVSEEYRQQFVSYLAAVLAERFNPPWVITSGEEGEVPAAGGEDNVKLKERVVGKVNTTLPSGTFDRLFGRDAQIRRILDAVQIGVDTNWAKRKHTLLSGPPGTGKTELCLTLAKALGEEGDAWLWFDATSTTKAGALEQLMKAPALPPILFVEEIEKCQENALRWLLSVMDERGEIRRVNYRVGNESKKAPLTLIATVNNVGLLESMDSGAIYSRFGNRVYFPPPDRRVMEQILHREVNEIGGKEEWVSAALKFGFDQLHITDCREMLNILLCGRDRLLDGSYQLDYVTTMPPTDRDALDVPKDNDLAVQRICKIYS